MQKKIVKGIGIFILIFIAILIAIPFFLEAKIADIIRNNVNNNIEGTFNFTKADLSLLSSFPNAEVSLKDISLVNTAPFEGDTLFKSDEVSLTMRIMELFKGKDEAIGIRNLSIDGAKLNIRIDEAENANYDITKDTPSGTETTGADEGFTLALESYKITNSRISYNDMAAGISLEVADIEHKGNGDLSLEKSELQTETNALVSFTMDGTNYLNRNPVKLDALLGIDLKENKYTFLRNEAVVNQLPLVFDGFVKVNEDSQQVDIRFKTPSSDFKNFLAVFPEEYSKNIKNVKTTGDFTVTGNFEGLVDETHIPKFLIAIHSENASFKYPDLPKAVTQIYIDADVKNTTGIAEDTYVDLRKASFTIDGDKFSMESTVTELLGNTRVNAHLLGRMNLANISQAYPMPEDLNLKGILNADVSTAFDMATIEAKKYENTKTSGKLEVRNFEYHAASMANPVEISTITMAFNPQTVQLREFAGVTGKSDFNATGTVTNLLGFMFNNESVKGNFELRSNTFSVNDFMVDDTDNSSEKQPEKEEKSKSKTVEERIKIPAFLDCSISASAQQVLYDNLVIKDVKGNLRIQDETATLSDMTSSIFKGRMTFNGEVSTKPETPVFKMDLGMDDLQIGETFKSLDLFKVLAPVADVLEGKLKSRVNISGNLTNDLTVDLQTISGNVLAELLAADINPEKAKLLSLLTSKLEFIKLDKINLKGLKTALSFENGMVQVKPFTLHYQDISIDVTGGHSFDKKLDYNATLQVPSKYLGPEVNSLIGKIDVKELDSLTLPVTANIGGVYTNPVISTDFTTGIKQLTSRLVEIEKQKLISQGKDKAKELIGGILSGSGSKKDSTKRQDSTQAVIKGVLGGVLEGNTRKKDTVVTKSDPAAAQKEQIKDKAKSVLGNLLGKRKDSVVVKKDSVN